MLPSITSLGYAVLSQQEKVTKTDAFQYQNQDSPDYRLYEKNFKGNKKVNFKKKKWLNDGVQQCVLGNKIIFKRPKKVVTM